jgi:hypothetical protein
MVSKIKKILHQHLFFSISVAFFVIFNFKFIILGYPIIEGQTRLFDYPVIYNLKEKLSEGVFPFYSEKLFSGYPIYQNPEAAYLNPIRIVATFLLPFEKVLPFEYTLFFIFGLIGFFKFLREKKISDPAIFFSHFIYFYSLPLIQKLGNTTFIYSIFLIPLTLYFLEKIYTSINSSKRKRYILLNVLVTSTCLLYGNYLSLAILLSVQIIYIFTSFKNLLFTIKYLLIYLFLCLSISLYAIFPAWDLYTSSTNLPSSLTTATESVNFLNSPSGLGLLLFILLCFVFLRHLHFKIFFIVALSINFILSIFKIDFLGIIPSLALSLIFASIVHHLFNFYEKEDFLGILKNISYLLIPTFLLIFINIDFFKEVFQVNFLALFPSLLSSLFILSLLIIYKTTHRKVFLFVIPVIAVTELLIFSLVSLNPKVVGINLINPELSKITSYYQNQRVVFDTKVSGSETLYYSNWNIYGFSSFVPKNYASFMFQNSLNTENFVQKNYYLLDNLGVYRAVDVNNNILATGENNLFSVPFKLLNSNENNKRYEINLEEAKTIDTKIKFDQNIEVFVNYQKIENPKVKDIFYSLDLNQGINTVDFVYNPRLLYFGIVFSLVSLIVGLIIFKELNV